MQWTGIVRLGFGRRAMVRWIVRCAPVIASLVCVAPVQAAPTWTPSFVVGLDAYQVAMSADGTTVYSGYATVAGQLRAAVQVRTPGGPLEPVQVLSSPGALSPTEPVIATGPDGRFMAAWREGATIETAVLPPGALAFGDVLPMPSAGDQPEQSIALALDAAGDGFLVWNSVEPPDGSGNVQALLRFGERPVSGNGLSSQIIDSGGPTTGTMYAFSGENIAVSDAGDVIVGWQRSDMSMAIGTTTTYSKAALQAAGHAIGLPVTLDTGITMMGGPAETTAGTPSVAMTPSGQAGVAWPFTTQMMATFTEAVKFSSATPAGGFAAPEDASAGAVGAQSNPLLALGPDGRAAVAFIALVSGVRRPQVAFQPAASGAFNTLDTVAPSGDPVEYMSLGASRAGELILPYVTYNMMSGKNAVAVAVATPGNEFGTPLGLASGLSSATGASAAVAPAGDGVAIWRYYNGTAYETDAAGYAVSGPRLASLQIPATGTAGSQLTFSVRPVDIWSPIASISWTFGDGATASGASVSHIYATPGDVSVSLTATDSAGNATSASAPLSLAPPIRLNHTPPTISGFSLTHTTFAVAKQRTALVAARRRVSLGTTFRFKLSEPAGVTIAIARETTGLRNRKRCVRATATLRKRILRSSGKRGLRRANCTLLVGVGKLKRAGKNGSNSVPFSGRLGTKALKPARYQAALTATDAAGSTASRDGLRFRVVRAG